MSETLLFKLRRRAPDSDGTPTEVDTLELDLVRPEYATAGYLSQLRARARISNRGERPVPIRRVQLVGSETGKRVNAEKRIPWGTTALVSIEAGASVDRPIARAWLTARRLRRDPALSLEVDCGRDGTVRSAEVEIEDSRSWTPEDEVKAALGVLVTGILWWLLIGLLSAFPRALEIVAWGLCATGCAWLCSGFYAQLWRGQRTWGTGLAIGPTRRVRPLTDVLLTCVGVWFFLTAPFAFATYLIDGQQLGAGTPMDRYLEAVGLYAWHAVDVLPFVNATDTLRWNEPVADYSHATGALLLLYKVLVLAPVVAAARAAWRGRTPHEPPVGQQPRVTVPEPPQDVAPNATSHPAEASGPGRTG